MGSMCTKRIEKQEEQQQGAKKREKVQRDWVEWRKPKHSNVALT